MDGEGGGGLEWVAVGKWGEGGFKITLLLNKIYYL